MKRPLRPRQLSAHQLACRNAISLHHGGWDLPWLGAVWRIALTPWARGRSESAAGRSFVMAADWGGARLILALDADWIAQLGQVMLGDGDLEQAPEPIRLALIETAFADLAARAEQASQRRLRITAAGYETFEHEGMEGYGVECSAAGWKVGGELWTDQDGLEILAGALSGAAALSAAGEWQEQEWNETWDGLPITLRFLVGWVDLPAATLVETATRDVILLDESWLQEGDGIMVQTGRNSAFRAAIRGTALVVTNGLGEIMADTLDTRHTDQNGLLADVTIRLTFDLGERSVTLGELRTLAPGFTFELGRELRHAVTIRANGMPIGEGELVDIDGKVGVSVLVLHGCGE